MSMCLICIEPNTTATNQHGCLPIGQYYYETYYTTHKVIFRQDAMVGYCIGLHIFGFGGYGIDHFLH